MIGKQKILIVDDDENIAELISLYLTKECFDTTAKMHWLLLILISRILFCLT